MKEPTPTIVNKLIERIKIHNNVKADIYFTAVELFDIPTEHQLIGAMGKVKQKKAKKLLKQVITTG